MGKPDKSDSPFSLILRPRNEEGAFLPIPGRVPRQSTPHTQFNEWFEAMKAYLPDEEDLELRNYFEFALLGLTVGFLDRDLSPFLPGHTAIIGPVLEDIRQVYRRIKDSRSAYHHEEFIFRAYDYGIHKAYYLDWDLYMSHEMY